MNKFVYLSSMLIVVTAGMILLWFLYILFWPMTIIKPNIQPYKVLTPIVREGHDLIYQVDACKMKAVQATVIRTFEDGGVNYPVTTATNSVPLGCHKTNIVIPIPDYIPAGTYSLKLDAIYEVNAFRTESYYFSTETFRVERTIEE